MIGAWWTKLERSVRPSAVVVGAVPGEDASQVPFAEDQDAIGEFGSGGQDGLRAQHRRQDVSVARSGPEVSAAA